MMSRDKKRTGHHKNFERRDAPPKDSMQGSCINCRGAVFIFWASKIFIDKHRITGLITT